MPFAGQESSKNAGPFTFDDMFSGEYAYRVPFLQFVGGTTHQQMSLRRCAVKFVVFSGTKAQWQPEKNSSLQAPFF